MRLKILIGVLTLWTISSCATLNDASVYESLGGKQKLSLIVEDFISEIGNDPVVFAYFEKASVSHFRQGIYAHLCDVSGGPCEYKGDSMKEIHTGMNISEKAFNRLVELLINALNKNNIDTPTQNRLLAELAPLRSQVMVD